MQTKEKMNLGRKKEKHWIVSIQAPLEDLEQIVGYVGRYTKRACLSEYKIEEIGSQIKFRYNDYKNTPRGEKPRESIKILSPDDFLDALLQHVPKKRYRMVRYYGLYNSAYLKKIPEELRGQKNEKRELENEDDLDWGEFSELRKRQIRLGRKDPLYCEDCERDLKLIKIELKGKEFVKQGYDSS